MEKRSVSYCGAAALLAVAFNVAHAQETVLTFDDDGTVLNGQLIDQNYGDRVTSSPDPNGFLYGTVLGGGTPNVEVAYNPAPQTDLWTTGYCDLTNVLYNEVDGAGLLQVVFTADAGYEVGLLGFEVGIFGAGLTLDGINVVDGADNVLSASGEITIPGGSTHTDFDFTDGLFAQEIRLNIDLTGLGGNSDNVGLDNIRFTQRLVPEPTTACLLVLGGLALTACRRRRG